MKKVLYFEGAGSNATNVGKLSGVGNCRIRTAFHLDDGRAVFLEIIGNERTKTASKDLFRWAFTGFVTACHYITDEKPNEDSRKHKIQFPALHSFKYSEAEILQLVNSLGASFDAVKVVPDLGGYRVFPEKRSRGGLDSYYYGDQFQFDPEMTARREAVYQRICEELQQYGDPDFCLWVDEFDPGLLHLLRHDTRYHKHWNIRTDVGNTLEDWMASVTLITV